MRRTIIILSMFTVCLCAKGQMIVNDPLNYAQIGKVKDEGMKQTQTLKTSLWIMRKAGESLNKVNSFIKTLEDIEKVISLSQRMFDDTNILINRMKNLDNGISVTNANKIIGQCVTYNLRITNTLTTMTDILTDNRYKMSDYERMELFRENLRDLERISMLIEDQSRRISRIESKIQLFKTF